ncbi:MAG: hypothetical protein ABFS32_23225, partial [Bacteroidota bacterium]
GYDYFPYEVGQYRVYQTHVINYNIDGSVDSADYQIKEIVVDKGLVEDDTTFRLERYKRVNESDAWVKDSVWSARINTYTAIVVEHNVPIIKLSFPVEENRKWDGNAMNTRDYDEYKMINVNQSYQLEGDEFFQTLEVYRGDSLDPEKIVEDDYHVEVFSRGVGLIHKKDIKLQYDYKHPGDTVEGIVFEQNLIETGEEL